jgi:hypothetical protein
MVVPAFGHHEDRTPTHGCAATREAAMNGFRQELAARVKRDPILSIATS